MREDVSGCNMDEFITAFQSTSLEWGKTVYLSIQLTALMHFNPLPSNEGRPGPLFEEVPIDNISIHFPRMREDCPHCGISPSICSFQSTSLEWGKTVFCYAYIPFRHISIHFPRTREDVGCISCIAGLHPFQSTSLEWGKTLNPYFIHFGIYISIHFPRMREDRKAALISPGQ